MGVRKGEIPQNITEEAAGILDNICLLTGEKCIFLARIDGIPRNVSIKTKEEPLRGMRDMERLEKRLRIESGVFPIGPGWNFKP